MDMRKMRLLALPLLLALGGCGTGTGLTTTEKYALYQANAGAPVQSFSLFGGLDGWTPLGDSALAVWTRPSQGYLLTLQGPCQDLQFAMSIALTSQMSQVYSRFDKVIPLELGGPTMPPIPCWIKEIRPLDVKTLRAQEQELRAIRAQEREATSSGTNSGSGG